ncbi:uncharacterized protein LOC128998692 [Macrosteles quadrilineatus]|nr:uncharacterized protein LOC128998379 isoform X2 [Macrosteles quadrilineatus]XP_054280468.1 uncharacterized protein LOC128998379 isoform X2 [Macrosteles quadrilineatus]XP_054280910.1 uncharacterized protein LOC128998692 [Macrosteles quadrilineatus]XP_054280911.1 uncharacterized protein LOC128998692 [Macrosteles quadrilineatus]
MADPCDEVYTGSPEQLDILSRGVEIALRYKELQASVAKLTSEVAYLERKVFKQDREWKEKLIMTGRIMGLQTPLTRNQLLKEVSNTMSQNKKLKCRVNKLQCEVTALKKKRLQRFVSPAKLALRKYLPPEKLVAQDQKDAVQTRDMVRGEMERMIEKPNEDPCDSIRDSHCGLRH